MKLSEQAAKINVPGILQVRRFARRRGPAEADVIYDEIRGCRRGPEMVDPLDPPAAARSRPARRGEDLLVPVLRPGTPVYTPPPLAEVRARAQAQLARFHGGVKRLRLPAPVPGRPGARAARRAHGAHHGGEAGAGVRRWLNHRPEADMRIGVIGSGEVGQTLSDGFLKHGHEVMRGSRDPAKLADWKGGAGAKARAGTMPEAARFGEVVVLAVKGTAAGRRRRPAPRGWPARWSSTRATPSPRRRPANGVVPFFTRLDASLMEELQRRVPQARFVKAFSCVGSALMVDPKLAGGKPTMFVCGNDDAAKQQVAGLVRELGWESEDMGKAESARAIEPLCMLWCIPGFLRNDWVHAFKVLRR